MELHALRPIAYLSIPSSLVRCVTVALSFSLELPFVREVRIVDACLSLSQCA